MRRERRFLLRNLDDVYHVAATPWAAAPDSRNGVHKTVRASEVGYHHHRHIGGSSGYHIHVPYDPKHPAGAADQRNMGHV